MIIKDSIYIQFKPNPWLFIPSYIIFFNIASEGNLLIDKYFNKKLPWFFFAGRRLKIQIPATIIWTLLITAIPTFFVRYLIHEQPIDHFPVFAFFTFIIGSFFLLTFNGIYVAIGFFKNWKKSKLEKEKLEKEKLRSDYKNLQDQVNPHFLFNNFNVLISEIKHDPATAIEFTRKLSQVYRYVLQSKNHDMVKLEDEINFIHSFIYLHQIRTGDALKISMEIEESLLTKLLPPLTLQILIENAIKHNVINSENPLYVQIKTSKPETLVIKNNINPKEALESTKIGLTNIKNRYKFLSDKKVLISESNNEFIVEVPLLNEE